MKIRRKGEERWHSWGKKNDLGGICVMLQLNKDAKWLLGFFPRRGPNRSNEEKSYQLLSTLEVPPPPIRSRAVIMENKEGQGGGDGKRFHWPKDKGQAEELFERRER